MACGGAPKSPDLLESAASWNALAGEVVIERAKGSVPRAFTEESLEAVATGLGALAVQLDSARDLDATSRGLAARDAREAAAAAHRLAALRDRPAPGEARLFSEAATRLHALADRAKAAAPTGTNGPPGA